jgi:hypothetical protein
MWGDSIFDDWLVIVREASLPSTKAPKAATILLHKLASAAVPWTVYESTVYELCILLLEVNAHSVFQGFYSRLFWYCGLSWWSSLVCVF